MPAAQEKNDTSSDEDENLFMVPDDQEFEDEHKKRMCNLTNMNSTQRPMLVRNTPVATQVVTTVSPLQMEKFVQAAKSNLM